MCEQADWMRRIEELKFSVHSLARLAGSLGSYEHENAANAARGIEAQLGWILEQAQAETKRKPR